MARSPSDARNVCWTFSANVRVGVLRVIGTDGQIDVTNIALIDRGDKTKIECKGRLVGRPQFTNTMRTVTFNVNGYNTHPFAPEEVIAFLQTYAFPKTEI